MNVLKIAENKIRMSAIINIRPITILFFRFKYYKLELEYRVRDLICIIIIIDFYGH